MCQSVGLLGSQASVATRNERLHTLIMFRRRMTPPQKDTLPGFGAKKGMVELIYLSTSKLAAFVPSRRPKRNIFMRKVDIKFSAVGFTAELAADMDTRFPGFDNDFIPIERLVETVN